LILYTPFHTRLARPGGESHPWTSDAVSKEIIREIQFTDIEHVAGDFFRVNDWSHTSTLSSEACRRRPQPSLNQEGPRCGRHRFIVKRRCAAIQLGNRLVLSTRGVIRRSRGGKVKQIVMPSFRVPRWSRSGNILRTCQVRNTPHSSDKSSSRPAITTMYILFNKTPL